MDLVSVLKSAVSQGCSDIHIVVGRPPMVRRNGVIMPVDASFPVLSAAHTASMIPSMLLVQSSCSKDRGVHLLIPSRFAG
jgi:Tfp pilus assembly pilus retraction ATPase PilT